MAAHTDDDRLLATHNTARFFVENRQVSWVMLIGSLLWGIYGYIQLPKLKDPRLPIRTAVAICPWPGASADRGKIAGLLWSESADAKASLRQCIKEARRTFAEAGTDVLSANTHQVALDLTRPCPRAWW